LDNVIKKIIASMLHPQNGDLLIDRTALTVFNL